MDLALTRSKLTIYHSIESGSGYVSSASSKMDPVSATVQPRKSVSPKTAVWALLDFSLSPSTWRTGPLIAEVGVETRMALVNKEESSCYYLPLTPRVSLPLPLQSAVQFSMSMEITRSVSRRLPESFKAAVYLALRILRSIF